MEVSIRNNWFSFGGSSTVKDMNEKDLLKVKGKIFTVTAKKFIYDLDGNLKYTVRNKFWRLFQRKNVFVIHYTIKTLTLARTTP